MKKIIVFILLFASSFCMAEQYNMRKCMLLPIYDPAGNSVGFKIYEEVERYLKKSKWCEYTPSSEVLEIFSKYREKLPDHLKDENVLKAVAERQKVGSLIRININYDVDKLKIGVDIVGENGSDVYFSEKTILNKIDVYVARTTLINWLELYETTLPYDGKVIGVLGDQITFTVAKSKRVGIGQEFQIRRFTKKNKHPLLKKIVEWDSDQIARGKIINISRGQALGVVKVYTSNKKVETGDWIKLEKYNPKKVFADKNFSKFNEHKYGKLGEVALSFLISNHGTTTSASSGSNKMSGLAFGVSTEVEAWLTRNYFGGFEYSKKLGSLSASSGNPDSDSPNVNTGVLKFTGGFKYLPMGFFYGPQVNIYTGWGSYSYQLDESSSDGFGANSVQGILIGVGGNIPVKKGLRVFGSAEVMPFAEFKDEDNIFGSNKNISSMALEAGVLYQWNPSMKLRGVFEVLNNTAKFSGSNSEVAYSDTNVKLGVLFTF